jgi:hypothetical protein
METGRFQKVVYFLERQMTDKIQKLVFFKYKTPSSEPFRIDLQLSLDRKMEIIHECEKKINKMTEIHNVSQNFSMLFRSKGK